MDSAELDARLSTIERRLSRLEASYGLSAPEPVVRASASVQPQAKPVIPELHDSYGTLTEAKPGNWLGIMDVTHSLEPPCR